MIVFRAGCPAVSSWLAATLILFGCTPSAPGLGGGPATAPAPNNSWVPPDDHPELAETPPAGDSVQALPEDLLPRLQSLGLGDVVDLALRNNPATRQSWASARAAADLYGASRGPYYPVIDGQVTATRLKTTATQAAMRSSKRCTGRYSTSHGFCSTLVVAPALPVRPGKR